MYYTYILKSEKDGGYYFGHCANLEIRLAQHNQGRVRIIKAAVGPVTAEALKNKV